MYDLMAQGITAIEKTDQIVVVGRRQGASIDEQRLTMRTIVVGDPGGVIDVVDTAYSGPKTLCHRWECTAKLPTSSAI